MPFLHLLADEGVDPGPVALSHQEGLHRLPSRGQLVQNGHVQIPVHQQRQGAGDGCGGHHQQVRVLPFGGQFAPLSHAEAVLLVGDHQPQAAKLGGIRQQRVGANRDLGLAGGQGFPDQPLLLHRHGAGEQRRPDAQGGEQLFQGGKVLLRQNFRGGHQGGLFSVPGGAENRRGGHHGFAAAHIALDQPVHRRALLKIRQNLRHRPFLGAGQFKGQGRVKGRQVQIGVGRRLFFRPAGPHQGKPRGKQEEFLKNQPLFRLLRLRHGLRLMNGPVGPLRREDTIAPTHRLRQYFLRGIADGQSLAHRPQHSGVAQPRRQRIDGQHPPGGHRLGIRGLKVGVCHIVANEIPSDRPIKDVFLPILQLLRREFGIEKGQRQPGGVVRHLDLGNVQALADVGGPGGVHHHGLEAGGHIRLQLFDGHQFCPVLIAPGKMANQVPEGEDIQIGKLLGPGWAHALEDGHRVGKPRHFLTSGIDFLYYTQNAAIKQRNSSIAFRQHFAAASGGGQCVAACRRQA